MSTLTENMSALEKAEREMEQWLRQWVKDNPVRLTRIDNIESDILELRERLTLVEQLIREKKTSHD